MSFRGVQLQIPGGFGGTIVGVGIIFFGHPTRELPALCIGLASGLGYGSLTVMLRGLRTVDPGTVVAMNFLGSGLLLIPGVLLWASFVMTFPATDGPASFAVFTSVSAAGRRLTVMVNVLEEVSPSASVIV